MLHDPEAGHVHVLLQLAERAAVALVEPVEEEPPRRVGERLEDEVVVGHGGIIGDQMVTCQAGAAAARCSGAWRRRGPAQTTSSAGQPAQA